MSTIQPGRYRHFYRALYGDGGLWVRPAAMWSELVERDGYCGPRFTPVEGD